MLSGITLFDLFEVFALAANWGLSVGECYQLVPWHLLSIIDTSNAIKEQQLKDQNNQ